MLIYPPRSRTYDDGSLYAMRVVTLELVCYGDRLRSVGSQPTGIDMQNGSLRLLHSAAENDKGGESNPGKTRRADFIRFRTNQGSVLFWPIDSIVLSAQDGAFYGISRLPRKKSGASKAINSSLEVGSTHRYQSVYQAFFRLVVHT